MDRSTLRRCAVAASLTLLLSLAASGRQTYNKVTDDIDTKYTSVGNLGLTITNFGTLGTRNLYWPNQPSCEYPRGSLIEHIWQGGFWVGAQIKTANPADPRNNDFLVSTGASDRSLRSSAASQLVDGFEFNAEGADSITELSTLTDDRPPNSQFYAGAISHQDFICDYTDRFTRVPSTGDTIANHIPMNIRVHQESYAWNFPFADFFVILSYTIHNASVDTLDSVYVGLWNNAVVRNTNLVRPGTPGYFNYTGQGFDSTQRMAYSFDFNGVPGESPANSYIGLKLLGMTPFPSGVDSLGNLLRHVYYNAWQYQLSDAGAAWFASPTDDYNTDPIFSRYSRLTQSMPSDLIASLRVQPRNVTYLLSTGPWSRLNPGDSIQVVYAVVCAKKFGTAPAYNDTKDQRKTLYANAAWAQQDYNGEDVDGNDILEPGEDIATRDSLGLRYEPDGKITRYLLPAPPRRPKARVVVENQSSVLYWDKSTAELSIDPISQKKNFEGYRIYRSNPGDDFLNHDNFVLNLAIVGEFDKADDNIGYNTGFSRIILDTPKVFPGDTVQYWYRFPPIGTSAPVLNGWQYLFGVSAFSTGDSATNVPSLESAKALFRVVPGTTPLSDKTTAIGVYPNPYYVNAYWDGGQERLRKIYFYNLPPRCEIRIFTLAGDVVAVLEHDAATSNGENIKWFDQFGAATPAQFAGGEHAWDLITRYDQAIATGLYLFTVEDKDSGNIKRGKFLVIK